MKLLDTSVAVDHLRGEPAASELLGAAIAAGEPLAASEVVRFELLAGVRPKEADALQRFFTAIAGCRSARRSPAPPASWRPATAARTRAATTPTT